MGFPITRKSVKSSAASHQSRTLLLCVQCPSCKMQPSPRPSTSALRAARAYDVSPNPWNVVKAQRALTLLIDSISPRFNGPRNTTGCGDEGLLCSSSERPLPSSIACCLCGKKHPPKRGSFCTETLATWLLVSWLATVVESEIRRTSSLFVLYLVQARLQCLRKCFPRCCVA